MNRIVVCAFVAVLIVAGCSGDDESASTAAPILTTLGPPVTTLPTSTNIAVATTLTTTSTSVAQATTIQVADVSDAVRAAVDLAQATFSACLVAMPACDPGTLAVTRGGDLLERNSARIEEWNALGYTVRDREAFRYVIESVEVDGSNTAATVTVCIADGSRLVTPNAAPDGSDVIVDDEFVSGRAAWQFRLDTDGVWRAFDTAPVGESASEDVCGAG